MSEPIPNTKPLPEELELIVKGFNVAIICLGPFDASQKSAAFYRKHCKCFDWPIQFAHHDHCIRYINGGRIEWVWINSSSGRRADDFDTIHALEGN